MEIIKRKGGKAAVLLQQSGKIRAAAFLWINSTICRLLFYITPQKSHSSIPINAHIIENDLPRGHPSSPLRYQAARWSAGRGHGSERTSAAQQEVEV